MQYRTLGNTDLNVSVVAMGCWAIAGDNTWGHQDRDDAIAAIRAALDQGINFFDTAPGYGSGESEQLLGEALSDRRDQAIIATKISHGDCAPDDIVRSTEKSLRDLGSDHVDLMQIHWPNWDIPFTDTFDALQRLREQGKIRYIGVSNFGPRDLTDALDLAPIVSNQLAYSLLARSIEFEVQPLCVEHGISILPYSPLAQGLLTGKFHRQEDVPDGRARTRHFPSSRAQTRHGEPGCPEATFAAIDRIRAVAERLNQPMAAVALSWLLHQPAVTSVLAGARRPDQVAQNIRAAEVALDEDTLAELAAATDPVKQHLGPRPDLWTSAQDCRMR